MEQWWFAVFGAGLALAGSLVQSVIASLQGRSERRIELLIDAYSDYLNGIAKRASILEAHSERTEQATALMVSGKQKMSAYALSNVVSALARLERTPMTLSSAETQKAMVQLIITMRQSIGVKSSELEDDIRVVLFSSEFV